MGVNNPSPLNVSCYEMPQRAWGLAGFFAYSKFSLCTGCHLDDEMRENEMCRTCSSQGRDEKCKNS